MRISCVIVGNQYFTPINQDFKRLIKRNWTNFQFKRDHDRGFMQHSKISCDGSSNSSAQQLLETIDHFSFIVDARHIWCTFRCTRRQLRNRWSLNITKKHKVNFERRRELDDVRGEWKNYCIIFTHSSNGILIHIFFCTQMQLRKSSTVETKKFFFSFFFFKVHINVWFSHVQSIVQLHFQESVGWEKSYCEFDNKLKNIRFSRGKIGDLN